MNPAAVRAISIGVAKQLGCAVSETLPLFDAVDMVRSVDEVVDRIAAMHSVAAAAYGFDRGRVIKWLAENSVADALTSSERTFLATGKGPIQEFQFQIEANWALFWSCGFAADFSFGGSCPLDFVKRLPDLKANVGARQLRSLASLRTVDELFQMADLAYCIHWAVTDAAHRGIRNTAILADYVVRERRRAFEWLLSNDAWDDSSLDT